MSDDLLQFCYKDACAAHDGEPVGFDSYVRNWTPQAHHRIAD